MPILPFFLMNCFLGCGGGGASKSDPVDPGKLWVQPSPATLTKGATLDFQAVPEVHSEAPIITSTTWTTSESNGGSLQLLSTNGQFARYTAPMSAGVFHLLATSNFGTTRYIPQPGIVNVIDPSAVVVKSSQTSLLLVKGTSGPFPSLSSSVQPLTNVKVLWSVVEPGFSGPGLIQLQPDLDTIRCVVVYDGDAALDRLPGTTFHIKAQSLEVSSASASIEVTVQR